VRRLSGRIGGEGQNMFWKNDKGLKRLEIIFQSGRFYPAKSRSGRVPSPGIS
jgi:hypothetical protein